MMPLGGPAGSGIGAPMRIKGLCEALPSTVVLSDTEMRASLTGGNVYWFEVFFRPNGPPTGATVSSRLVYSGSVNYAVCWNTARINVVAETTAAGDNAAINFRIDDGSTITSGSLDTTGNPAVFVAVNYFCIHAHSGLIAPSTDGVLSIENGVNGTSINPRGQPYSTLRVEQVN